MILVVDAVLFNLPNLSTTLCISKVRKEVPSETPICLDYLGT